LFTVDSMTSISNQQMESCQAQSIQTTFTARTPITIAYNGCRCSHAMVTPLTTVAHTSVGTSTVTNNITLLLHHWIPGISHHSIQYTWVITCMVAFSGIAKVGNGWAQTQPIMSGAQPILMFIVSRACHFHVHIKMAGAWDYHVYCTISLSIHKHTFSDKKIHYNVTIYG